MSGRVEGAYAGHQISFPSQRFPATQHKAKQLAKRRTLGSELGPEPLDIAELVPRSPSPPRRSGTWARIALGWVCDCDCIGLRGRLSKMRVSTTSCLRAGAPLAPAPFWCDADASGVALSR